MSDNSRTTTITLRESTLQSMIHMQFALSLCALKPPAPDATAELINLSRSTLSSFFHQLKDQHPDVFNDLTIDLAANIQEKSNES